MPAPWQAGVPCFFVPDAPALLLIPLALILGAAGGAGLGAVAAGLRTRYGVNEIISTVMLNYIIVYLLSWLLSGGAWGEVGATVSYQQSPPAPEAAQLPNFDDRGRLHLGFAIALAASLACAVLIARTPLGFEIRGARRQWRGPAPARRRCGAPDLRRDGAERRAGGAGRDRRGAGRYRQAAGRRTLRAGLRRRGDRAYCRVATDRRTGRGAVFSAGWPTAPSS